jgi:hypothetical protein
MLRLPPESGHYRVATDRRLERHSIGIMIYIIIVDYGEANARFEVGK